MTKKDYILIASCLNKFYHMALMGGNTIVDKPQIKEVIDHVRYELAEALIKDNPRFNRDKFYQAVEK